MALARKQFARPAELIAGKPAWSAWEDPDADRPTYRETHYFGRYCQFGTLSRGSQEPDINGFKILTYSSARGADTILAGPVNDPLKLGSVQYRTGLLAPHSAVGQNGNMAIYLTQSSSQPYLWLIPKEAFVQARAGVTFVRCEKTTMAIWPINLSSPREDRQLTDAVQIKESPGGDKQPRWANSKVLKAVRQQEGVYGFALEIDEENPDRFIDQASRLAPETDEVLVRGAASMKAVSGRRVRLQWGNTMAAIRMWRDGRLRDWDRPEENAAYRTLTGDLIDQDWQGDGTLSVVAGGHRFMCQVTRAGNVSFSE